MAEYGNLDYTVEEINKKLGESGGTIPVIVVEGETPTQELQPNTYYKFGKVTSLTLTFAAETPDILNEYMFEFTAGASTTLVLPSTVKWMGGEAPTLEADNLYQVSIVNNIAVIGGASTSLLCPITYNNPNEGYVKCSINGVDAASLEYLEYKVGDTLTIENDRGGYPINATLNYKGQDPDTFYTEYLSTTIKYELESISVTIESAGAGN